MSAPPNFSHDKDTVLHSEFMGFVRDEESHREIVSWAAGQGLPANVVQMSDHVTFAGLLTQTILPKTILVDIDGQDDPVTFIARLKNLAGKASAIVALGTANDVKLYRTLTAAGAADYIVKPVTAALMAQTCRALSNDRKEEQVVQKTKTIVVIGARGGVGASTLAVNMAWHTAQERNAMTALFDLDLHFGTGALALDLEPGRGLRVLLGAVGRLDALMVSSAMVAVTDRLSVLCGEEAVDEPFLADDEAVQALVKTLGDQFSTVIVDLPRHLLGSQKGLLAIATDVVVVAEQSLAGIRDVLRIKQMLQKEGSAAQLTLVGGYHAVPQGSAIDKATFEKNVQTKLLYQLPDEAKLVTESANAGKAVLDRAPQSAYAKTVRALALQLCGQFEEAPKPTKRLWAWMRDRK
ncbi:MAG: hypothetical protein JO126_09210 [Alphaproteobacteria bacterium]|nr:hypothetical protein [Alphaproteobacteria bacterium]